MTLTYLEARTRQRLVELGTEQLEQAVSRSCDTWLVVPTNAWVEERKLHLLKAKIGGVRVQTHAQMVSELWDLHGDGTRIVSGTQRMLLARPLLTDMMGVSPSQPLLNGFCRFLQEAITCEHVDESVLKAHEHQLCNLVERYRGLLQQHGLVELAQAQAVLCASAVVTGTFVVEEPDASCAHAMRFYEGLGKTANVVCIMRNLMQPSQERSVQGSSMAGELSELAVRLYAGCGQTPATGHVLAGEAYGSHIEGELLVELVRKFMEKGAKPGQIAVVFQSASDSHPHIQDAFAHSHIPFSCEFTLPFKSTPFGAAFVELVSSRSDNDDDAGYKLLSSFIATPYSGLRGQDIRALQMRWRQRAGSHHAQRIADITQGFAQGNADAAVVKERLEPAARLLETGYASVARQMFANAKEQLGAYDAQLADDARAADALLDYLEECDGLSCDPIIDDICQLPVMHQRRCASGEDAVSFLSARDLGVDKFPYVVLANLDVRHYPMASPAGPFDVLLSKMGIDMLDTLALRQRCLLLDVLGAAGEGFGFYRVCHDKDASEICQSALWDELMDAYAQKGDKPASGHAVLEHAGAVIGISEAQVFSAGSASKSEYIVARGCLAGSGAANQLTQYPTGDAIPFSPTALEDYYRCPYRWFTSRRVGYNGMDNEFSAAAQGNLAHSFFEAFYKELNRRGHKRITPQNLDEALALGNEVFDKLLEKGRDKPKTGLFLKSELDRLNCEVIRKQVLGLLERDAFFLPGFEPTYLELELGRGTGSTLMYAGVPVRGKVDRVDVDGQGRAVIIDYKLSSLSAGYGLRAGERMPLRIQTDIYALLVQRHFSSLGLDLRVVGSVYRSYSSDALRGVYESGLEWGQLEKANAKLDALPSASCAISYSEYLDMVEGEVSSLLSNLAAGDIEPRPIASGVCDYCKALQFCPVGGR